MAEKNSNNLMNGITIIGGMCAILLFLWGLIRSIFFIVFSYDITPNYVRYALIANVRIWQLVLLGLLFLILVGHWGYRSIKSHQKQNSQRAQAGKTTENKKLKRYTLLLIFSAIALIGVVLLFLPTLMERNKIEADIKGIEFFIKNYEGLVNYAEEFDLNPDSIQELSNGLKSIRSDEDFDELKAVIDEIKCTSSPPPPSGG